MTRPAYIHGIGMTSAAGVGLAAHRENLWLQPESRLTRSDTFSPNRPLALGIVPDTAKAPLPNLDALPDHCQSRNNQLLWSAWLQLDQQWRHVGAAIDPARVAIIVGTSTSGIRESEASFKSGSTDPLIYERQQIAAPAAFLAHQLNITGPAYTLSTACTSGAKALAAGRRLLQTGIVDWVIAGGADALCGLTVNGFMALEAVSEGICNPMSANRTGINIGEGAALFLLSNVASNLALVGCGESSDAHHISAPEPNGNGAEVAIRAALQDAHLTPADIGYINLHGTATGLNDKMESLAIARVFGTAVSCSSTKPFTGHTLGAAGALEAGICALAILDGRLPPHVWDGEADPDLPDLNLVPRSAIWDEELRSRRALSTSFAFGGNNTALIFSTMV